MENINQKIELKSDNTAEQESLPSDYIERRERERGGAFDFHVSIPKIFKENGEVDLERMQQIVELIKKRAWWQNQS